jgi:hypothetical protein
VGLDSLEEVRSTDIFVYHTPESEALFRDIARPTCMATGHWEKEITLCQPNGCMIIPDRWMILKKIC